MHQGCGFGRDTRAPMWENAVSTSVFTTTEALACRSRRYHRLFCSRSWLTSPSWPRSTGSRRVRMAGAVLLKAAERVYGLVKAFAGCLVDKRAPEKIRHTLEELVGQRVFGIAVRASRRERWRPPRRRPDPQAAARPGPGDGRAPGVAADGLEVRERRGSQRALPDGARVGRPCHRAASPPPGRPGAVHHDRSGPDRRPDARRATAQLLQRALWQLVLLAVARVRELRRRAGTVPVCGGAATRQRGGLGRYRGGVCRGCSRCCAARSREPGFSYGSTGALRRRRSSTFSRTTRGSITWLRWPRTRCCSATPSRPCERRGPRARTPARPSTSTPRPAMRPRRGAARAGS